MNNFIELVAYGHPMWLYHRPGLAPAHSAAICDEKDASSPPSHLGEVRAALAVLSSDIPFRYGEKVDPAVRTRPGLALSLSP